MRVAVVHYWFVNRRGGEKVVEAILELFPQADVYTHVCDPSVLHESVRRHRIFKTFIQRLPFAKRLYQKYLPLMPLALEALDLNDYDLVISSESGPAKGVIVSPDATHICYCHSPMRYLWDMYHVYRRQAGFLTRLVFPLFAHRLRMWDQLSAQRVDHFIANSRFVARRIRKYFGRDAAVIYPPVGTDEIEPSEESEDFYLWVGELVAYKRPDLAVEACTELARPLVVVGDGELRSGLKDKAGPTIKFAGRLGDDATRDLFRRCKALIFPGKEDFGMVPVEAMAFGKPVIAYDSGGATETVLDDVTGVMFSLQTAESLMDAMQRFESRITSFDPKRISRHADQFSKQRFMDEFRALVDRVHPDAVESETSHQ